MNKENLIKILYDWNFWEKELPIGQKRPEYLDRLSQFLQNNKPIIITGARRSGKSILMRQLANDLIKNKKIAKNRILMINLEDPRFRELNSDLLQNIYETYQEFLNPQDRPYLFLDEIQEVKDWEKWVRVFHELSSGKIILSGSNANLLSSEIATVLTGRHLDITVFPLSFREFLSFHQLRIQTKADLITKEIKVKSLLRKYLNQGGFPETVENPNQKEILIAYFNDLIYKDLVRRYNLRQDEKMKTLLQFYFNNTASLITFNSIRKFIDLSTDTIEKFSSYFENIYLLSFLKRFSFKTKEQIKSPRKVYAIDNGLANAVGFSFSQNRRKMIENAVFSELKRQSVLDPQLELFYWKDDQHREVDFVVKNGQKINKLYQVCWEAENPKTREREIKSLLKGMEYFSMSEGYIISFEEESVQEIKNKRIKFIPLWKWLLNPNFVE